MVAYQIGYSLSEEIAPCIAEPCSLRTVFESRLSTNIRELICKVLKLDCEVLIS